MFTIVIFLIQATGNANPDSITYLSSGYHIWNDKSQLEGGDEFYSVVQEKRTVGSRVYNGNLHAYDITTSTTDNFPGYVQFHVFDSILDVIRIFLPHQFISKIYKTKKIQKQLYSR